MSGLLLIAVLAQAPVSSSVPPTALLWWRHCAIQASDSTDRIERTFVELNAKAGLPPRPIARCVQAAGLPFAVFLSDDLDDNTFLFIYNAEITRVSDRAMYGLIAHEIAHEILGQTCRELSSEAEQICENKVDLVAAQIVGAETVQAALEEYRLLYIHLVANALAALRERVNKRVQRLHEKAP